MEGRHGRPLVSVVISFLNGEKFIHEAVESVLAQTYDAWELLLMDDGSSDASSWIATSYAEQHSSRIFYREHEAHENRGVCASRNAAIGAARGKYVALLDVDDVWRPDKLEEQVTLLESYPTAAIVFGMSQYWYSWTKAPDDERRDYVPSLGIEGDALYEPSTLLRLLYPLGEGSAPCPSNWLMRRELIDVVGGFEEEFRGPFQIYEDQAFLVKVYTKATAFVSNECWDLYRVHPDSCMSTVKAAGKERAARSFFLEWLEGYLAEQQVRDARVWAALQKALQPFGRSIPQERMADVDTRELRWSLRFAEDNVAELILPQDDPGVVRIAIDRAGTAVAHDVQLNQRHLRVTADHEYSFRFRARADRARGLSFGLAQAHEPWRNLGLFQTVELTPEWQEFQLEFTATHSDDNARVHFDVGGNDASVELADVLLTGLPDGRPIEPGVLAVRPGPRGGPETGPASPVPFGKAELGSLRRVTPISEDWGWDRGLPIDRYYIEAFLARHADDIRGRVLEVGDNAYTLRFGADRVTSSDVLHVDEGHAQATIIADLTRADHIPSDRFDCIILTQTLQFIYDVRAAIQTLHRILASGGVLLATIPGISHQGYGEWSDSWYWSFTGRSAQTLFSEVFDASGLMIEAQGNVLAATAFLYGLAAEELDEAELGRTDPAYQVLLTARAVKAPVPHPRPRVQPRGRKGEGRALVLMYHRVATERPDMWDLCVNGERFGEHLEALRAESRPASLTELLRSLQTGSLPDRSVVVTFDDGYADNLLAAKPLLERYGVPATFFLTSGYVGGDREFWWDELERILFEPAVLPDSLRVETERESRRWDVGAAARWNDDDVLRHRGWKPSRPALGRRHEIFVELHGLLKSLPASAQWDVLDSMRSWAGVPAGARSTHRPLSLDEVRELGRGDLVEIGAHTVTHPVLSGLEPAHQRDELEGSRSELEGILGRPVTTFAYPYGSHDVYGHETLRAVRDAGFEGACTTTPGVVTPDADRFLLPRVMVLDWEGDQFAERLAAWFEGGAEQDATASPFFGRRLEG